MDSKNLICPACREENPDQFIAVFQKKAMPCFNNERHFSRESALSAVKGDLNFYFVGNVSLLLTKILTLN
jgi:hypothetical protein